MYSSPEEDENEAQESQQATKIEQEQKKRNRSKNSDSPATSAKKKIAPKAVIQSKKNEDQKNWTQTLIAPIKK